jgi:hypothetical protein
MEHEATVIAMIINGSVDEGHASKITDTMTYNLLTRRYCHHHHHFSLHIITNQMMPSLLASTGVT